LLVAPLFQVQERTVGEKQWLEEVEPKKEMR
jgi:hypothetical protein